MGTREERTIELTVKNATGLKKVTTFGKQSSYVIAYVYRGGEKSTRVDNSGDRGLNPDWNTKLLFTVDEQLIRQGRAFITLDIHSHGSCGTRLIGTARVPLSDLPLPREGEEEITGSRVAQDMSLNVHRPSGSTKGVINVSVALGERRTFEAYQPPYQGYPPPQGGYYGYPQQGYPQPVYYPQKPRRGGGGLGLGLLTGLLGGFLLGDAIGGWDGDYYGGDYYGGDYGGGDFGGGDFGGGDFGGGGF